VVIVLYIVNQKFITNNRSYSKFKPEGIVLHSTANEGGTDEMHYVYFNSKNRGASAHDFIDWDSITQLIPHDERAGHAGYTANRRYLGFELCEPKGYNPIQFQEVWKRATWRFADVFINELKIYKVTKENLPSHKEISDKYPTQTDHQDPVAYFKKYGKTVDDFRSDVQKEIDNMINKEEDDMTYFKTINDVPDWAKSTIQKLINKGSLKGDSSGIINVSEDFVRTFVVLDREGLIK
jgi:N-acetylmuramoyl-L-alanine amidase CwlA